MAGRGRRSTIAAAIRVRLESLDGPLRRSSATHWRSTKRA
jgi:hypothetical protein